MYCAVIAEDRVSVPRNELCNHLRQAISEQRRVDASYASAEGSIPHAQAAAMSIEPRTDVDIRLVLPPEPGTSKGTKGRPVRKHRHVTKVYMSLIVQSLVPLMRGKAVYYDKG